MAHPANPLDLLVTDLIGRPGAVRDEVLDVEMPIELTLASVDGARPVRVQVRLSAIPDGVLARGTATYVATIRCNRCLTEWDEAGEVDIVQAFRTEPDDEGVMLGADGRIDLYPIVRDEVGLALPLVPLCDENCAGLCPTCGTDLNTEPCDGHPTDDESPFAVLRQLLEPEVRPGDPVGG